MSTREYQAVMPEMAQRCRVSKAAVSGKFQEASAEALRKGIDAVYGTDNPVQRCRRHELENVVGYLSKELQGQVGATMRAAWRLETTEGMARLRTQAQWLERSYPKAAAALETEKNFRKTIAYRDLWMLKAGLDDHQTTHGKCPSTVEEEPLAA